MHWSNWKPFHYNIFSASTCPEENPTVYPPLLCSAPIKVHLHSAMTFWNSSYPDLLWHRKGAKRVNWIVFFCSFSLQTTPVLSTKTLVKDIWSCSWLTRDQISHLHYFLVAYQMYAHKYQYLRIYVITYLFHMNPIVIMHWIIMFSCSVLWKKERKKKKIIFWYLGSFIYKQCLWSLLDGL